MNEIQEATEKGKSDQERVVMFTSWVDVQDRLPTSGLKVLAIQKTNYLQNRVTIVGHWVEKFSEEAGDSEFDDYCEEKDEYYLPEGWYEDQYNWGEYAAIKVNDDADITHWRLLPDKPVFRT